LYGEQRAESNEQLTINNEQGAESNEQLTINNEQRADRSEQGMLALCAHALFFREPTSGEKREFRIAPVGF